MGTGAGGKESASPGGPPCIREWAPRAGPGEGGGSGLGFANHPPCSSPHRCCPGPPQYDRTLGGTARARQVTRSQAAPTWVSCPWKQVALLLPAGPARSRGGLPTLQRLLGLSGRWLRCPLPRRLSHLLAPALPGAGGGGGQRWAPLLRPPGLVLMETPGGTSSPAAGERWPCQAVGWHPTPRPPPASAHPPLPRSASCPVDVDVDVDGVCGQRAPPPRQTRLAASGCSGRPPPPSLPPSPPDRRVRTHG